MQITTLRKSTELVLVCILISTLLASTFSLAQITAISQSSLVDVSITQGASTKTTDAYSPNPVAIDHGDTITWTNNDFTPHTVASGNPSDGPDGLFGSTSDILDILFHNDSYSHTFTDIGEFPYFCILHPNMVSEVIVGAAETTVTVETDQPSYETGDDATISGTVAPANPERPLLVRVISEEGTLVRVDLVNVDSEGFYDYSFHIGGPLFKEDLSYSVIVTYAEASAETVFSISSPTSPKGNCLTFTPTIVGTEEDDFLEGSEGDDVIFGLGGDDTIDALSGNDIICGGPGIDTISGGDGDDRVSGGRGNDLLFGDGGDDMMLGGTGYDRMFGGEDNDSLLGGRGNDFLDGGEGDDNLDGQEGDDREVNGPVEDEPGRESDIVVELDDIEYGQGETVEISGNVDGADEDDDVDITIHEADGGSDNADTVISNDDGDFDSEYQISDNADDGIYQVEVEFGTEDPVFTYFLVDEDDDAVHIETDRDVYEPGDEVMIEGEVQEVVLGVDEVEITVIDPSGDEILSSQDAQLDVVEFEFEFDLDDDLLGRYAIIVEYDDEEGGFSIFEVAEDGGGGSGSSDGLTAKINKVSFLAGESITVTGVVPSIIQDETIAIGIFAPDGTFTAVQAFPEPNSSKEYSAILMLPSWLEVADDYRIVIGYDGRDVELEFDITGVSEDVSE